MRSAKARLIGILFLFMMAGMIHGVTEVKNPDKPLKGEWDFRLEKVWAVDAVGEEPLTQISSVKVSEAGLIYAVEPKRFRILILDSRGKLLQSVGKKGEGPGEFRMVWDVQLSPSHLIVPDMSRLQVYSRSGEFIRAVTLASRVFPRYWLDDQRFVTLSQVEGSDEKREKIEIFDLKTSSARNLVEVAAGKDLRAASGGIRLQIRDRRTTPSIILAVSGERLYYGRSDLYRIQGIDLKGGVLGTFSLQGRQRRPISEARKRKRFERVVFNGGRLPKDMVDQMIKQIPDYCNFFDRMRVDDAGRIWLFVTDMENESGREVDIFSPAGKYLWHGEIRLPDGWRFQSEPEFSGTHIIAYVEDEEGEGALTKFSFTAPGA